MEQLIKNFNNFVKKTIFKLKNKTNNKFQVSTFNKCVIAIISILFIYIFYLLIPLLYDKNWLQNKITEKLKDEFNISLINTADISYRILPRPHFSIKNSTISLAKFGIINIYINQNNFFNKNDLSIDEDIPPVNIGPGFDVPAKILAAPFYRLNSGFPMEDRKFLTVDDIIAKDKASKDRQLEEQDIQ